MAKFSEAERKVLVERARLTDPQIAVLETNEYDSFDALRGADRSEIAALFTDPTIAISKGRLSALIGAVLTDPGLDKPSLAKALLDRDRDLVERMTSGRRVIVKDDPALSEKALAYCVEHGLASPPGGRFEGRACITAEEYFRKEYQADPFDGSRVIDGVTQSGVDISALYKNGWAAKVVFGKMFRQDLVPASVDPYEELLRNPVPSKWNRLSDAYDAAPAAHQAQAQAALIYEDKVEVSAGELNRLLSAAFDGKDPTGIVAWAAAQGLEKIRGRSCASVHEAVSVVVALSNQEIRVKLARAVLSQTEFLIPSGCVPVALLR